MRLNLPALAAFLLSTAEHDVVVGGHAFVSQPDVEEDELAVGEQDGNISE
jgi:hypothetical protein